MSTTKKPAFAKVMTPKGTFIYPTLTAPDTKFKAEGEFRCRVRLSAEDSEPLLMRPKEIYDGALPKMRR